MSFTFLGAEFLDAPADLSDTAWRLHVEALLLSTARDHDLLVPKRELSRRSAVHGDYDTAVTELLDAGWWADSGDRWWIGCRFRKWQQTSDQRKQKREADALAQRRKRQHDRGDHTLCLHKNCPFAPPSAPDTAPDTGTDSGKTSVRSPEKSRAEQNLKEGDHEQTWTEHDQAVPPHLRSSTGTPR